ncbi:MAG: hypothetical protein RL088_1743 [Verrucomicrobiota bacterium]|jgi:hypothetical protein
MDSPKGAAAAPNRATEYRAAFEHTLRFASSNVMAPGIFRPPGKNAPEA